MIVHSRRKKNFQFPGRNVTLLFGIFSTFMIVFYSSNMRVNIISPQFEKKMETFDDVIAKGQRVYIAADTPTSRLG